MDILDPKNTSDDRSHYCRTREFSKLCEQAAISAIRRLGLGHRVTEQEITGEIWRRYLERHGLRETWKAGDTPMVLLPTGPKKVIVVLWGLGMDILNEMIRVWKREEALNGDDFSSRPTDEERSAEMREWIDAMMATLSETERETLRAYEANDFERKRTADTLKINYRTFSRRLGTVREKIRGKRWDGMP